MQRTLITIAGAGLLALVSCGDQDSGIPSTDSRSVPAEPPPPPSKEVVEALRSQAFGSKLLGHTHYLVGERFVGTDLPKAPEYYLLNFSGSF